MPAQQAWEEFFDPPRVLATLHDDTGAGDILEFGCGYGTFTIPAARRTAGTVYALDIDAPLVAVTAQRAAASGLHNVVAQQRDFMSAGSGRPGGSVQFVMIFNILHLEEPLALLREAQRVLRPGGCAGVIHWRTDIATPRGPPQGMRPSAGQCQEWAHAAGFSGTPVAPMPGAPWHWGMRLQRG